MRKPIALNFGNHLRSKIIFHNTRIETSGAVINEAFPSVETEHHKLCNSPHSYRNSSHNSQPVMNQRKKSLDWMAVSWLSVMGFCYRARRCYCDNKALLAHWRASSELGLRRKLINSFLSNVSNWLVGYPILWHSYLRLSCAFPNISIHHTNIIHMIAPAILFVQTLWVSEFHRLSCRLSHIPNGTGA